MILHVDMDAFYASVEQRERPELRGRAVIVGGRPEGRGVVAAASYPARRYGVRSAMPSAQAKRLCPHATFLPPRMSLYAREAARIREVLGRYTPLVEPLSLDEAFLDVSASERLFGSVQTIARRIKDEIREEIGLVASVGVAPSKFVAKIASDFDKPDGLVCLEPGQVQGFLDPLPVGTLWGVGRSTARRFARMGVRTIANLRAQPPELLGELLGRQGEHFWRLAHGIDERRVTPEREARSLSHETTFGADVERLEELRAHLHRLAEQVAARLRHSGRRARRVRLKLRFEDFRTISREMTLARATDSTRTIRGAAQALLLANAGAGSAGGSLRPAVRLLGVGVEDFAEATAVPRQDDLFGASGAAPVPARERAVDEVVDAIRSRFGARSVRRGAPLPGS